MTLNISIHALREESDLLLGMPQKYTAISIHALREESDLGRHSDFGKRGEFRSTLSARRATSCEED